MNKPIPQILVRTDLAQALVDYLKRRPYDEVSQLIQSLVACPSAKVVEEKQPELSLPENQPA